MIKKPISGMGNEDASITFRAQFIMFTGDDCPQEYSADARPGGVHVLDNNPVMAIKCGSSGEWVYEC